MIRYALLFWTVGTFSQQPWTWRDAEGVTRTRAELNSIVQEHSGWLDRQPQKADASKSAGPLVLDLVGKANLSGANLTDVWLAHARLDLAFLNKSNLSSAILSFSSLKGADLGNAKLVGAYLNWAHLEHADLLGADLRGSHLVGTVLTGANFFGADLQDATYVPATNPDIEAIANSRGLGHLRWDTDSRPIFALRKALIEGGFRQAAKQVAAAISRHGQSNTERVLFDWTCEWGANWFRPLKIICGLCLICTVIYWVGLHSGGKGGLYLVATGQKIRTTGAKERALHITGQRHRAAVSSDQLELDLVSGENRQTESSSARRVFRDEARRLGTAFLFSLISAFNIGFREFNFGSWIRMAQPRDFDLRARGWMRTVSGLQSLFGLALLALSLLSYFNHPFE